MRYHSLIGLSLFVAVGSGCSTLSSDPQPTTKEEPGLVQENAISSSPSHPSSYSDYSKTSGNWAPPASNYSPPTSSASMGSDSSPTIRPGQCWVHSQIKPRKVESAVEITIKDSTAKISVTPAEIRQGYRQVVTREGTKTYRIEPATYKSVSERVQVRPEMTRFVVVPAVYETQQKTVVVEEAKTVLEACQTAGTRYAKNTGASGYCAREIPAKEKTVNVQALVQPETTRVDFEPALYKEVTRWVVDQPARAVEVSLAPSVADVPVQEVVRPEQTRQTLLPAITQELNVTRFEGSSQMVSRQAVCNADITPELIHRVQQSLIEHGYQPGRPDGLLGERTVSALADYQTENGLAVGALTFETLDHLGIRY